MNTLDFAGIGYFTPREVTATGARLQDVQLETMIKLDRFRKLVNRRVRLLKNGMTTGDHRAKAHPMGLAVDITITTPCGEKPIRVEEFLVCAILAGFRDIGVYWNGKAMSFHLGLNSPGDTTTTMWQGHKEHPDNPWTYGSLVLNPMLVG